MNITLREGEIRSLIKERYQLAGRKEEFYAEITDRYSNLRGALRCLIEDCNVSLKENPQTKLEFE